MCVLTLKALPKYFDQQDHDFFLPNYQYYKQLDRHNEI